MRETELYEELYNLKSKEFDLILDGDVIYVHPNRELKQKSIEQVMEISKRHGAELNLVNYAGRFEIKF